MQYNTKMCHLSLLEDLTVKRPTIDPYLDDSTANYTQPKLQQMHTYDLMLVLSHLRAERTNMYKNHAER